eukprot:3722871-Rhodomonas_salina.1
MQKRQRSGPPCLACALTDTPPALTSAAQRTAAETPLSLRATCARSEPHSAHKRAKRQEHLGLGSPWSSTLRAGRR